MPSVLADSDLQIYRPESVVCSQHSTKFRIKLKIKKRSTKFPQLAKYYTKRQYFQNSDTNQIDSKRFSVLFKKLSLLLISHSLCKNLQIVRNSYRMKIPENALLMNIFFQNTK